MFSFFLQGKIFKFEVVNSQDLPTNCFPLLLSKYRYLSGENFVSFRRPTMGLELSPMGHSRGSLDSLILENHPSIPILPDSSLGCSGRLWGPFQRAASSGSRRNRVQLLGSSQPSQRVGKIAFVVESIFKQPRCLFHRGCRLDCRVFLFFFGLLPQSHSIPLDGK
jgi:hypothetical protein